MKNFTQALCMISGIFVLMLSACDTQNTIDEQSGDSIDVILRAASLQNQFQNEYRDPMVEYIRGGKPLRHFENMAAFEAEASALHILATRGNEPLKIHEKLAGYQVFGDIVPYAELALADDFGQIIIGDIRFELQGDKAVHFNHRTGEKVGEVDLYNVAESTSKVAAAVGCDSGLDACVITPDIRAKGANGSYYDTRAVYYHDAYQTWLGSRRAKARTRLEMKLENGSIWGELTDNLFPQNTWVKVRLVNKDSGKCEVHNEEYNSSFSSGTYVRALATNGRDGGHGVSYSQHTAYLQDADGFAFYFDQNYFLEGLDDDCDGTTGESQVPW